MAIEKFNMENDDVYEGDFFEGEMNGNGKMIYADGRIEKGNWKSGKFIG